MRFRSYLQRLRQFITGGRKARRTARAPRRLAIEGLEDRTVPATIAVSNGVLTYTAFIDVANNLTISHADGTYTFTDTGEGVIFNFGGLLAVSQNALNSISFSDANISSMVVNLGGLNDDVRVDGVRDPLTINAGTGQDDITVDLYNFFMTGIAAPVTVHGGPDADIDILRVRDFTFVDSHDCDIDPNTVDHASAAPINYDGIQSLLYLGNGSAETIDVFGTAAGTFTSVKAGYGDDTVNVHGTSGPLWVDAGADNDRVHISPLARNLNNIQGIVTAYAGSGSDVLTVSDQNSGFSGTYMLDSVHINGDLYHTVDRPGAAPVRYRFFNGIGGTPGATIHGSDGTTTTFYVLSTHPWATTLNTGTGVNTVNVRATTGALRVNGESGFDTVNVGSAANSLEPIQGALHVTNAGSYTALNITDTGDGSADLMATLTDTSLTGLSPAQITWVEGDVRALTIHGGFGGNTFTVLDTPSNGFGPLTTLHAGSGPDMVYVRGTTGALVVNAGFGNDAIHVGSDGVGPPSANTLDAILGPVTVNGDSHIAGDSLTIHDEGSAAGQTYTVTADQVARLGGPTIHYGTVESLALHAGSFNDRVNIYSTHAQTPLTVFAGLGDDHVELHDTYSLLDGIQGAVTVYGQGHDTPLGDGLELRDDANPLAWTYTFTASAIARQGPGPQMAMVTYHDMDVVGLEGGLGNDTYHVLSTAGGWNVVASSGGSDVYVVGGPNHTLANLQGSLNIAEFGNEADWLILNDQGNSAAQNYALTATEVNGTNPHFVISYNVYGTVENVVLNAASGGNAFLVDSLSAATALTLNAGAGSDRLNLLPGGIQGVLTVNGQGGTNTLSYAAYATDVTANLTLGTATDIAGGVTGIHNVLGGSANDLLVGDAGPNALVGGPGSDRLEGRGGRDLLIGGLDGDTLLGGADFDPGDDEDILVGGATPYDDNPAAWNAILAVWAGSGTYAARVAQVMDAAFAYPLNELNLIGDGAADTLAGGLGWLDWFLVDSLDIFLDPPEAGETVTPLP
jgi:hypothetical protein